ncbi:hypothetical protein EDB86DRAFT_2834215 [Lactarius hatsudake]|nr:hypothetical protein EDB86DRAFT_2834215 [Lactarius hatsudake]
MTNYSRNEVGPGQLSRTGLHVEVGGSSSIVGSLAGWIDQWWLRQQWHMPQGCWGKCQDGSMKVVGGGVEVVVSELGMLSWWHCWQQLDNASSDTVTWLACLETGAGWGQSSVSSIWDGKKEKKKELIYFEAQAVQWGSL